MVGSWHYVKYGKVQWDLTLALHIVFALHNDVEFHDIYCSSTPNRKLDFCPHLPRGAFSLISTEYRSTSNCGGPSRSGWASMITFVLVVSGRRDESAARTVSDHRWVTLSSRWLSRRLGEISPLLGLIRQSPSAFPAKNVNFQ